jgi:hypothetical protein
MRPSIRFDSSMKRTAIGLVFIVHGLAHSGPGMWAMELGPGWLILPLWWLAQVGFLVAGLGLLGVPWCRRIWEPCALVAAVSSILLLQLFGRVVLAYGLVLDTVIIVFGLRWGESSLLVRGQRVGQLAGAKERAPGRRGVVDALATALVLYVALVLSLRPWYSAWGTSADDRGAALPGDALVRDVTYRTDRAVTIHAPADSVWPWLVQIGQDRGGFYSYERLEHLIGADIHNADRIHPEWQSRRVGDRVRATQKGYLGNTFGEEPGWRVAEVRPGQALVLDQWGAFVLRPVDSVTTRLHVRTRGSGKPGFGGTVVAPFGLLMFEPVHFVMERRMLLGIKERAERGWTPARRDATARAAGSGFISRRG